MKKETAKAFDSIFKPKSIAVIGASDTFGKWGYRMVERPLKTGYTGAIYPINPGKDEILGLTTYQNVAAVPDKIDLAIISTPAATIPGILRQCIEKGIKGAIVISAGFAEAGEEGKKIEHEMVAVARAGGIRLVGPNCMGIWSAAGHLNLCFPVAPQKGSIAFISQSGTFGVAWPRSPATKGMVWANSSASATRPIWKCAITSSTWPMMTIPRSSPFILKGSKTEDGF